MRNVHLVGSNKASTSNVSLIQNDPPIPVNKSNLIHYSKNSDSMEMIVSRSAALDGLPLCKCKCKFCRSKNLWKPFEDSEHNLQNSP